MCKKAHLSLEKLKIKHKSSRPKVLWPKIVDYFTFSLAIYNTSDEFTHNLKLQSLVKMTILKEKTQKVGRLLHMTAVFTYTDS